MSSESGSLISEYDNLPEPLKKQISKVHSFFEDDEEHVIPMARDLYRKGLRGKNKRNEGLRKNLFRLAILKAVAPDYLLDPKFFPYVCCYDNRSHLIKLEKVMV